MVELDELQLRARKFAPTKVGLVRAAVSLLDERTLDDLQVRELCEAVQISSASFFNYFPKKSDLVTYFVQLWTIDVAWHALCKQPKCSTARDAIERIFEVTAQQVALHPGVMGEVLAAQARLSSPPGCEDLTLAERVVAFPGRPGIEAVPARGLDSLLPELIERAVREGELPVETDLRGAFLGLTSLFFGVPLVLRRVSPALVGPAYREQLGIYWAGLVAMKPRVIPAPTPKGPKRSSARKSTSRRRK